MTAPADIDRALTELRRDVDELGARLLELELDDTRKLLDTVGLTGATAERWSSVSASVLEAWRGHALLEQLLERTAELRGERSRLRPERIAELQQLVDGPSIELSRSDRVAPGELVARLTAVADDALAVVGAVAVAWESATPRLDAARAALEVLVAPMDGAVAAEPAVLASLEDELDRLAQTLATDPLSKDEPQIDALSARLEAADRDRSDIAALRQQSTALMVAAQELMDRVEQAQRDGETAHALVIAKIARPSVPEPIGTLSELDAGLRAVAQLIDAQAWRDAHDVLLRWTADATAALDRAAVVADENRGPIAQRNELRGRLKAYQAKARNLRALEDPAIEELFAQARDALYDSPTDLTAAARLVAAYQRALADRTEVSR